MMPCAAVQTTLVGSARFYTAVYAHTGGCYNAHVSHTECGCQQQWNEGSALAACLMGVEGRAMFRLCHPG